MTTEQKKPQIKDVLLRAFKIQNPYATQATSGVREHLEQKLNELTADQRCLVLNPEDVKREQDLISYFDSNDTKQSLFCTMLKMSVGNDVQHITDDLLHEPKFSINELKERTLQTAGIYKKHYYFSVLGDYLVTASMPQNQTVKALQTYLAWLLSNETLEITPMIDPPQECKLSDLQSAIFEDPDAKTTTDVANGGSGKNAESLGTKVKNITKSLLLNWLKESDDLADIDELEQVISAQLLIKFKKPRKMSQQEYEKILGANLKPISDLENVKFQTKDRKRVVYGKDLLKTKLVPIELTETGFLVEEQLKQTMAHYLNELSM